MYVRVYMCTCIYTYVCIYICMYVPICMYVCIYVRGALSVRIVVISSFIITYEWKVIITCLLIVLFISTLHIYFYISCVPFLNIVTLRMIFELDEQTHFFSLLILKLFMIV